MLIQRQPMRLKMPDAEAAGPGRDARDKDCLNDGRRRGAVLAKATPRS
jgi:hypothetical protein